MAILGVMVTVMLPQVMGTLREHQLRSTTRAVIGAGRHAMSLAVLSQRQMTLVYDLDTTTLTIRAAAPARGDATNAVAAADAPAAARSGSVLGPEGSVPSERTDGAYAGAVAIVDEEVVYKPQGVAFTFIEVEGEDGYRAESGVHTIVYYSNGRCTPHTIAFSDEDGATAIIEVDALSSARVVRE